MAAGKTDYGRLSLYLGAASIAGGLGYWYWQWSRAKAEERCRKKYREMRRAFGQFQDAFGLPATERLDEATDALLRELAARRVTASVIQGAS